MSAFDSARRASAAWGMKPSSRLARWVLASVPRGKVSPYDALLVDYQEAAEGKSSVITCVEERHECLQEARLHAIVIGQVAPVAAGGVVRP